MGSDGASGGEAARHPEDRAISSAASARLGLRRATALAISSGLFGILYGAACASLGISPALAALSCVLVFSGAVQFAMLGMLADPVPVAAIAVSSLLICNRLFLMGVSMADHFRGRSWAARLLAMPVLTDGAWAATVAETAPVDRFAFFVSAGIWILLLWVAGTLLGGLMAGRLEPEVIAALRFSGVLFLALLLLLVVRNAAMGHAPWIASALTAMAASQVLPLPLGFLAGVAVGAVVIRSGASGGGPMTVDERFAISVGIMAVVAFGCRAGGLVVGTLLGESPKLRRLFDMLPACAMGAVLGPSLVAMTVVQSIALVVSALVFLVARRFLLALASGTAVLLSERWIIALLA